MASDLDFRSLTPFLQALLHAFAWTIALAVAASLIGIALGSVWGVVLCSTRRQMLELRWLLSIFSDVVKGIPPLVLLLLVNYVVAPWLGLGSVFWIAAVAFGTNLAAFIADVIRSAIVNVGSNFIEAGKSLGMSGSQITRHVLIPLSVRPAIPALALLCLHMLKMTSLASVVSFPELTYVASGISSTTFRPVEPLVAITLLYLLLAVPFSWVQRRLERAFSAPGVR